MRFALEMFEAVRAAFARTASRSACASPPPELGAETPYAPKTMAGHPKLRPQLFPKRAQPAS